MLDDLVCPSCQVLLPDGTHICKKCGREVQPEKLGVGFIDVPRKVYSHLVQHLGHVWANIVAGGVCLILVAIFLLKALIHSVPSE
jgi:hypothetical protein